MLAANALKAQQEFRRRRDIAALALNRLDDKRGDLFGIDYAAKKLVFDIRKSVLSGLVGTNAAGTAIGVWIVG